MNSATELRQLVNGFRVSQAIHVAAVLGLSDLLADGPLTVAELAERSGCHAGSLFRLLRALATAGLYEQLDDGRFGCTPLGDALRADAPRSPAGHAAHIGRPYFWRASA